MPNLRTKEDVRRIAREAREAFYNGNVPQPRQRTRPRPNVDRVKTADRAGQGPKCPGQNALWRQAVKLAKVLASGTVPDDVYAARNDECFNRCQYCTETGGKHYCGCCGCPAWHIGKVGSGLEYKNTKKEWACPRPDPAFGLHTGE